MTFDFQQEFSEIVRARFSLIYLQTFEEERALQVFKDLCSSSGKQGLNRDLYVWSQTQGLRLYPDHLMDQSLESPYLLFDHIEQASESGMYVLFDFHVFLDDKFQSPESYQMVRRLRELSMSLRNASHAKTIVIVSPVLILPQPLQKDVMVLEFPLPAQQDIRLTLDRVILRNRAAGVSVFLTEQDKELLCKAALGLTLSEAEGTFARAMASNGVLEAADVDHILAQKQQILKKSGALEYVGSDFNLEDVGGLDNLKVWLERRNQTWMDAAQQYNLPTPKGVMLTGVPGCGKSLIAKAIASLWKLPLLRLDLSTVFGMYVGESEANLRRALSTAEALAPCILWIDEIDKSLGGSSGGSGDSGTTQRVFGNFLTWMQEKNKPVFVFATANKIDCLPPELLRKGRFDEIFFVDLPNWKERRQILQVHLRRRLGISEVNSAFQATECQIDHLSTLTKGCIGSEIEEAINSALYEAFFEKRSFQLNDVENAIHKTVRFSDMQSEYLRTIREWARQRAVPAGSAFEDS